MMQTYPSGNPRVHISTPATEIEDAIAEYTEKIEDGTFKEADIPWFKELIGDLRQELSMRGVYKMIVDPGHGWLRVPLKEIVGMTFSKFSYADGEYAYLEEDCDAPQFMKAKSLQWQDIPTEHIDNDCFVRRLGRLPGAIA